MRMRVAASVLAVCLAAGCSSARDDTSAPVRASEPVPTPTAAPMEVDQQTYRPGDRVNVRWPGEDLRGIAYSLDSWTGSEWKTAYYVSAVSRGVDGAEPTWWDADEPDRGWVDIGVGGPGPDIAVVPETAEPGEYRLCTANSLEQSCVLLTVAS